MKEVIDKYCATSLTGTLMTLECKLKHPCHPCMVKIHINPMDSTHLLSFRSVSKAAISAYHHVFQCGNSASSARSEYIAWL